MQVEIHVLQSFPPANLNRDENGMPKSTVFGGRTRARISSQCQKRAVRSHYHEYSGLDKKLFAKRSKNWITEVAKKLKGEDITPEQAQITAACAITVFTEKPESKGKVKKVKAKSKKTEELSDGQEETKDTVDTMLFLGNSELDAILEFLRKNLDQVKKDISAQNPTFSKDLIDGLKSVLTAKAKPGDVALFGRMMPNLPMANVDAAVQMAHAIGVNKLEQEFDFFTAVEELAKEDATGSGHMGETAYNSSTYYRFATLDTNQLERNLGSDDYTKVITKAFVESFVQAIPTGHKTGFAPHTRPAAVMIVVREGQPISLVDAFENPIAPEGGKSLLENAVSKLDSHWAELCKMYGDKSVVFKGIVTQTKFEQWLKSLADCKKDSIDELIKAAIDAAFEGGE